MNGSEMHVVFGANGPVGVELARQLVAQGIEVRAVCRSGRVDVPAGVEVVAGDAGDKEQVCRLCEGASILYCCVGMPYTEWREQFPPVIGGLIAGAEQSGARLVFADNLYCYGPADGPFTEDLPATRYGVKPALRARLAENILEAHRQGRISATILRASDFYGPGVTNAMLGERVFPALLEGKKVQLLGDVDLEHTYTYVPDFARGLITVALSAQALGRAWHVPSAATLSTREVLEIAARLSGRSLEISTLPGWVLGLLALFNPLMRELKEMQYQWKRPFVVDHSQFADVFWDDATPLEEGLAATIDWYRDRQ